MRESGMLAYVENGRKRTLRGCVGRSADTKYSRRHSLQQSDTETTVDIGSRGAG